MGKRLLACVSVVFTGVQCFAGWVLNSAPVVDSNTNLVVNISKELPADGSGQTTGVLWLDSTAEPDVLLPTRVNFNAGQAFVSVFVRGEGNTWFTVHDVTDNSSSTIRLEARQPQPQSQIQPWLPKLNLLGEGSLPVMLANQQTTAMLDLKEGSGSMPATTHISAVDHRGRLVVSRFYNTFELTAGAETFAIPAAGDYMVTLRLLEEESDRFPKARYRAPMPINYGESVARFEVESNPYGITTQSVFGSRVALEHLPTTATVAGIDRLRVVVLGRQSNEMLKNRWPYMIAGSNLLDMQTGDRRQRGPGLARWQRRLGSSFVPTYVNWPDIQRTEGSFRLGGMGETLQINRRNQVRPVISLFGRAAWNNEFPSTTTSTLAAWERGVSLLGSTYRDLMWAFYCWDRPEATWPNPADYRRLLMATANGLRNAAKEGSRGTPLLTGPTNGFNAQYLREVVTSETLPLIAGISFDLFPQDPKKSPEENGFPEQMKAASDFLGELNQTTVSLWIAGTGWPVGPDGVTPDLQANYLVRTHVMALANGIHKVTWNNLIDQDGAQSRYNRWRPRGKTGLLDARLMPRLSGVAYNVLTYAVSGATSPTISRQGNATVYSFNLVKQSNKWPGKLYVAWTDSPETSQNIELDMTHGGGVYAFDYLGAEIPTTKRPGDTADPIAGTYTLSVGYEPVYIWDAGKPPSNGG